MLSSKQNDVEIWELMGELNKLDWEKNELEKKLQKIEHQRERIMMDIDMLRFCPKCNETYVYGCINCKTLCCGDCKMSEQQQRCCSEVCCENPKVWGKG